MARWMIAISALCLLIVGGILAYRHWFRIRPSPEPYIIVDSFTKDNGHVPPLVRAAQHGDVTEIRELIARGADVNAADSSGFTPLMVAAMHAQGAVPDLLAAGAIVNAKDKANGETALTQACRLGELQVVEELVEHLADVNTKSRFGRTPLQQAVAAGSAPVVRYLLRRGAKLSDENGVGFTELTLAVVERRLDIVELLLRAGADVNARDSGGMTALAIAESEHDARMVRLLKQAGAR